MTAQLLHRSVTIIPTQSFKQAHPVYFHCSWDFTLFRNLAVSAFTLILLLANPSISRPLGFAMYCYNRSWPITQ